MAATHDGPIICIVQDIHCRELIDRIGWAVRLRWFFVAAALLVALVALLPFSPPGLEPELFVLVAIALLVANLVYRRQARRAGEEGVSLGRVRRLCLVQVMGDYLALAVVAYALGTVETPVLFFVLPNVIVVALFFTRLQGVLVTLLALVMVTTPLVLEAAGILPTRMLFDTPFKALLLADPWALGMLLATLFVLVLLCWYLATEITARLVRNELELEASYEQMVRLDEERTRAVLRGTHELKAPLAAIKSYVFTLRDGYAGELPPKAQEIVARIGRRCDRLLARITDIMRLSNLRTYVYTGTQFQEIALTDPLAQFAAEAGELGQARDIRVRFEDHTGGRARVRATREHLHTLFSNLLSNAVQYSFDGGEVTLRLTQTADRVAVEVEDHGIGIPDEARSQLFDEFYRAANAAAHHEGGTGLGLPIAQATARVLGAVIEVEAAAPCGTLFRVLFEGIIERGA